jgi:carboxypeptidase Taq
MNPIEAYEELAKRSREIAHLDSAMELAYWDQRTNIPAKGHSHRVRHLAAMAKMRHRRFTDARIEELLEAVENSSLEKDPMSIASANVREWRRLYKRARKIPEKLATELIRAGAQAEAVWEKACPRNDWTRLKSHLARVVDLKRQECQAIGFTHEPYDALLEEYEPGETSGSIEALLRTVGPALVQLRQRICSSQYAYDRAPIATRIPVSKQEDFATKLARRLGYSLESGRIDVSSHPFSTGLGPGDVRIVSRFNELDLREGLFAVAHEIGHAFYVQGLPLDHWGEPVCRVASLGMDESQALMWEFFVARSRGFWDYFHNDMQSAFSELGRMSEKDVYIWINHVNPAALRINADEVTYDLHILLRFEVERALINGTLEVGDLPDAWSEKSMQYLGHRTPDHRRGVMQDVHWPSGLFGYFPSYTIGHVYAAQLYAQAEKELGDLNEQFARGDFSPLRTWLREHVHSLGAILSPRELIRNVTGNSVDPHSLITYLETKYENLFRG